MYCPKCGKETDTSGQFCQWCGAPIEAAAAVPVVPAAEEVEETPDVGVYAGLGRRFVAFIVDFILIVIFGIIAVSFFNQVNGIMYLYYIVALHAPIASLTTAGTPAAALTPIVAALGLFVVVVPWLYYAGFESSRGQATPGKVLMRLEVTDLEGNRLSFARATLRFFGKFISLIIVFIGFVMIGLTKKRQGLHDKIAGTIVLLQD